VLPTTDEALKAFGMIGGGASQLAAGENFGGFLDDYGPVVLPSVAPGVFRNRRNSAGSACTRSVSSYMT
jgi:hypothetical protein